MKKIAVLLVLVIAVAGCKRDEKKTHADDDGKRGAAAGTPAQTATGIEPGLIMPAYEAVNLDGSKFDLASRRKNVVLLNLWATWCGPCRYEIPELQRIHDTYAKRGFEVVGVSVDEGAAELIQQFAAENKMTYPLVHDPDGKIANILEASVLPTSIMIDRDGRIIWKKVGAILENDEELKTAIEKAL
ncbi:MAG TPA: TlpA disulfide reductase family protein [Thermoanaerobaculia bacterium]|jgi:peroxiredoxin